VPDSGELLDGAGSTVRLAGRPVSAVLDAFDVVAVLDAFDVVEGGSGHAYLAGQIASDGRRHGVAG